MKLVIDIPDEMYDWAINYNKFYQTYSKNDLLEVIQNGKPVIVEADKKLGGYNCDDCISRQAVLDKAVYTETEEGWSGMTVDVKDIEALPPVKPQEPKTGYCKDCKYFEYDSWAKVDGVKLIFAHEICKRWGDGCKTKDDGYCFLFEPQESEVME